MENKTTSFALPAYHHPDTASPRFAGAPDARWQRVERDGVAPEHFHGTSMYPEYFKLDGRWRLAEESRMDGCVVVGEGGSLRVVESRHLRAGDRVILGRTERCEEGIYVHYDGFAVGEETAGDRFAFRQGRSRETSYAKDYDDLAALLRYEREHGRIVWVMGPAFAFDAGARAAMEAMIGSGYCHGLLAGNALATHDLEAALTTRRWDRTSIPSAPSPTGITTIWMCSTACAAAAPFRSLWRTITSTTASCTAA